MVLDNTDAGRRLERLACEGTGCEDVTVPTSDTKLSILAERTLGDASRRREIMKLNGLEGTGHRLGDRLAQPQGAGSRQQGSVGSSAGDGSGSLERAEAPSPAQDAGPASGSGPPARTRWVRKDGIGQCTLPSARFCSAPRWTRCV